MLAAPPHSTPAPAPTSAEARRQYRVAGATLADLEAALCLDALALPAHILDLSAEGAGLMLDPTQAAAMKRAIVERRPQNLGLSLSLPGLPEAFRTPASTRHVSWGAEGTRVGLAFRVPRERLHDVDPALRSLLNQRGVVRVALDPAQPLPVRVEGIAGDLIADDVPARDLSLGGVGLGLAPGIDVLLPAGREVRLTLGLRPHALTLRAVVRHASVLRDRLPGRDVAIPLARIGFAFDPRDTAHPRAADRLANEVMRRQLEARKTAGPR